MSIFPLFDPETTLTSRFFTATFLYNRLFPGHKAEGSHNPYYTAAIENAYNKGIPVILFDRKTGSDKYTAFIGALRIYSNFEG